MIAEMLLAMHGPGIDFAEEVYRITKLIPRGQVATYGQIATYVASPRFARAVGTALRNLPRSRTKEVPWHRVINAAGRISAKGEVLRPSEQERRLVAEGIVFDRSGRTNLAIFGWAGPPPGVETGRVKALPKIPLDDGVKPRRRTNAPAKKRPGATKRRTPRASR